ALHALAVAIRQPVRNMAGGAREQSTERTPQRQVAGAGNDTGDKAHGFRVVSPRVSEDGAIRPITSSRMSTYGTICPPKCKPSPREEHEDVLCEGFGGRRTGLGAFGPIASRHRLHGDDREPAIRLDPVRQPDRPEI